MQDPQETQQDNVELEALAKLSLDANDKLENIEATSEATALKTDEVATNTEATAFAVAQLKPILEEIKKNTTDITITTINKDREEEMDLEQAKIAFSLLRGPKGEPGKDGKDATPPTKDELRSIIKPLIPKPIPGKDGEDGKTPTPTELRKLIKPLIPEPIPGEKGEPGYTPVKGKDYFDGKDGKTPKKGEDYFTEKEVLQVVERVADNVQPKIAEVARRQIASKTYHLGELADVNTAGSTGQVLAKQANGTFAFQSAGAGGGHTIQDEGVSLTQRTNLNFVGAGVTVTDGGAGPDSTIVTIPGGGGGVSDGDKGDITVTASGATWTVDNDAITFAKMQNIATDRLLGRDTAASGDVEELTVGGGIEFTGTGGIQTSAFTGDATKTAGGTALTLATVNSNVGSFGSASQVGTFTVNGKGLITAAGNTSISVASGAVTDFTEAAQDAVGAMVDTTLIYNDATPLLQRAALTGDVTASAGSNATTIANDAVTYAKMQNMTDNRVLGRAAGSSGDPQELTVSAPLTIGSGTIDFDETATLGNNARLAVSKNSGATVGTRRKINFIEGSNVTLTIADDAGNEEVDVTIASTGGGGGGGTSFGTTIIDQTPDNGTYALLGGTVNGSNAVFTVSNGSYLTGTLVVYLNGQLQTQGASNDYQETTPGSGTFTFVTAPKTGDIITAVYQTTSAVATTSGQATVDFGPITQEDSMATVTVSTSYARTASKIIVTPAGVATADHDPDDYQWDNISGYVTNIVDGVSFDIVGVAPNGSWGDYVFNYVIA